MTEYSKRTTVQLYLVQKTLISGNVPIIPKTRNYKPEAELIYTPLGLGYKAYEKASASLDLFNGVKVPDVERLIVVEP